MAIKTQPRQIPQNAGVYFFKDVHGNILYIGKAANLLARLSSYFAKNVAPKTAALASEAESVNWEIVSSEIEALIKEAELIKKYRPKYNVLMRDDKQYFYVGFTKEKYPKIFITHQPLQTKNYKLKTDYIGPFTEGGALRSVLKTLRRAFPYCACKQSHRQPCLNAKLGKCLGICCLTPTQPSAGLPLRKREKINSSPFPLAKGEGGEEVRGYNQNISAIKKILSGKNRALTKQLKKDMQRLSAAKKYEEAGHTRDQIRALERIFEHRAVIKRDIPSENQKALNALKAILGIENIDRIEAYDIANIRGKFAYGGMAVWENGSSKKNDYRIFKIRGVEGSNDPAMVHEVLSRRFNHPEWQFPEVIIIDGGKPQLSAISHTLYAINSEHAAYGLRHTAIIALTKNKKHAGDHVFVGGQKKPIALDRLPPPLKNLILHLDSEAHRFAIKHYRNLHKKSLLT
ncbi:hypothetical protein A2W54_00105 [Candidatus Giovannonibacteria bacterium RIFCSPHIGHO2_02_43_13]|uniref:Excinuclease ABC subunit C n=1 Tax=Candidatus Giovannonibacteria bacterium RIFCSPHIGHO2_02_43_13 TaxID=1798330 RepID=A0A1F5WSI2_9BACT|nr:MAG: Excinuclease ABC, C subunit domain protein [Parcubacteria group bacterium GW2011_GWA2_44_13]OGF74296.1 MAG: hypothetical protein A3E06_02205 [Candidatus Giovannonibacteria bacterium RIFCSPHIGHO2_12_FULL_44_42]OGF78598.1 MAG: hypothetical protein A2W54_00105 [Candidatus Giovannonibacteria bacterium RIFCSPHIGHO2_02_43_13]OGF89131.1 MAG: hypothetical protein A3I94_00480 [Candidatus Giovannonibacteria bacterium RIFCSPLOWO2_02_FULL_43_54]OGF96926.1 MAG: hypothetical protein A3H08_00545 [Cand